MQPNSTTGGWGEGESAAEKVEAIRDSFFAYPRLEPHKKDRSHHAHICFKVRRGLPLDLRRNKEI